MPVVLAPEVPILPCANAKIEYEDWYSYSLPTNRERREAKDACFFDQRSRLAVVEGSLVRAACTRRRWLLVVPPTLSVLVDTTHSLESDPPHW